MTLRADLFRLRAELTQIDAEVQRVEQALGYRAEGDLVSRLDNVALRVGLLRREVSQLADERRTVGIIAAIVGEPPQVNGDRLADTVRSLRDRVALGGDR